MQWHDLYVGLMSGTSADAVDVVLVDFSSKHPSLISSLSSPLSSDIRQHIHALSLPGADEIDRMGELDQRLGKIFAANINELLEKAGIAANQVKAIGSHGQTIRHRPPGSVNHPFTLQIGDPNVIAQETGITTVADFRRRDMAAGGHGAPLVPAFHQAVFHDEHLDRAIINIGGMANITWLPASGQATGFDTGPGNVLMDAWIQDTKGLAYDQNGDWAASGQVDQVLLSKLLQHPFFNQQPPKSTGREDFNLTWLKSQLAELHLEPQDVQATLLALTAISITNDIKRLVKGPLEAFVCGGGAFNRRLMQVLQTHMGTSPVVSSEKLGISPNWVEAMAFAWLAKQTMNRQRGNLCAVTGAQREVILGGVYFA
jgi:anhydro-N-acetylmuramic acid kinase